MKATLIVNESCVWLKYTIYNYLVNSDEHCWGPPSRWTLTVAKQKQEGAGGLV